MTTLPASAGRGSLSAAGSRFSNRIILKPHLAAPSNPGFALVGRMPCSVVPMILRRRSLRSWCAIGWSRVIGVLYLSEMSLFATSELGVTWVIDTSKDEGLYCFRRAGLPMACLRHDPGASAHGAALADVPGLLPLTPPDWGGSLVGF